MSIKSRKSGLAFHGVKSPSVRGLTPKQFGELIAKAAKQEGIPVTGKLISDGLGTIDAEGGFDGSLWEAVPSNLGPWAEDSSFGPESTRLNPWLSTLGAMRRYKMDGNTYQKAWWHWEEIQGEQETGPVRARKYVSLGTQIAKEAGGSNPSFGEELPLVGGVVGDVEGAVEGAVSGAESGLEFLQKLAETILDFRALGNLMAHVAAWFIRLIARAIWDYVIAPLLHWGERAVSFYWVNFFGTGVEHGSGIGYQLRNNAGAITIFFWATGYAILWSDGNSAVPVPASESLLGQGVKGIESAIARRNLVKPKDVKEKTPKKPNPKSSEVVIEKKQTFSVSRKRPVTVGHTEGRQRVGNSGLRPNPIPRPEKKGQIILPPGAQRQTQSGHKVPNQKAAQHSRPGMDTRGTRVHRSKSGSGNS